jgi:hypothetical protein
VTLPAVVDGITVAVSVTLAPAVIVAAEDDSVIVSACKLLFCVVLEPEEQPTAAQAIRLVNRIFVGVSKIHRMMLLLVSLVIVSGVCSRYGRRSKLLCAGRKALSAHWAICQVFQADRTVCFNRADSPLDRNLGSANHRATLRNIRTCLGFCWYIAEYLLHAAARFSLSNRVISDKRSAGPKSKLKVKSSFS